MWDDISITYERYNLKTHKGSWKIGYGTKGTIISDKINAAKTNNCFN